MLNSKTHPAARVFWITVRPGSPLAPVYLPILPGHYLDMYSVRRRDGKEWKLRSSRWFSTPDATDPHPTRLLLSTAATATNYCYC